MAAQLRPYALGGLYGQMLIITTEYFDYILPPDRQFYTRIDGKI